MNRGTWFLLAECTSVKHGKVCKSLNGVKCTCMQTIFPFFSSFFVSFLPWHAHSLIHGQSSWTISHAWLPFVKQVSEIRWQPELMANAGSNNKKKKNSDSFWFSFSFFLFYFQFWSFSSSEPGEMLSRFGIKWKISQEREIRNYMISQMAFFNSLVMWVVWDSLKLIILTFKLFSVWTTSGKQDKTTRAIGVTKHSPDYCDCHL